MRHNSIFDDTVEGAESNGVGPCRLVRNPVHNISPLLKLKHALRGWISSKLLNSVFVNGMEKIEAPGSEPRGLGFASYLLREGFVLASNGNHIPHTPFRSNPLHNPTRRVLSLPQRRHVSGGTSPRKRASDPLKCCTRLWAQLTAIYGAYYGLCVTDAINRLTGRLVLDNGHGQVYGDLRLCSPTAWAPRGYRELRKADYCQGYSHG